MSLDGASVKPSSKQKLLFALQLALFSRLCNEVLARRTARRYDAESLTLAARLLEQNPEVYTVWNYRREALEATFKVGACNVTVRHAIYLVTFGWGIHLFGNVQKCRRLQSQR